MMAVTSKRNPPFAPQNCAPSTGRPLSFRSWYSPARPGSSVVLVPLAPMVNAPSQIEGAGGGGAGGAACTAVWALAVAAMFVVQVT